MKLKVVPMRLVVGIAALAVFAGGCSSSGSNSGTTSGGPSSSSSSESSVTAASSQSSSSGQATQTSSGSGDASSPPSSAPSETGMSAQSSSSSQGADVSPASLVPEKIKAKGTLVIVMQGTPPGAYVEADGKTLAGYNIDFSNAIAAQLGLKPDIVRSPFDTVIPGLQDGRFDMALSGINITEAREKVIDLVRYQTASDSIYARTDFKGEVTDIPSLCGYTVAALASSSEVTALNEQAKKCDLKVSVFNDQSQADLAVSSGRADLGIQNTRSAKILVSKSNDQLKIVGNPLSEVYQGIGFPKGNGMAEAVAAAMKVLIADGTYKALGDKWGDDFRLTIGATTDPVINGPGQP